MVNASNSGATPGSSTDFNNMDCERLKIFLKDRGISTTGYKKADLVKLAKCAAEISVETDPDSLNANALGRIRECLKAINFPVENPFTLNFTNDLSVAPKVGLLDIFNFLIEKRSDFDKKATKAYKSFEDYRLFYDGHVLELKCCRQPQTCCFYARVRPTQRQKTYMLRDAYEVWMITDHDGDILLAFCQCPAGVDGACRHVAAALYAVEDHETKSVTDGPAVWVRRNTTCEVADKLQNLPVLQARYNNRNIRNLPTLDNFDPRAHEDRIHTAEREALFAEMLRKELPQATVLECFSDGGEAVVPEGKEHNLEQFTVAATAHDMTLQGDLEHDFQHLLNCLPSDERSLQLIEQGTRGQSDCPQWMELRKGRITASEMKRVCTRDDTLRAHPGTNCDKLVQHIIIGKNAEFDTEALAWGRKKEKKAREHYCCVQRKTHKKLTVTPQGLQISQKKPFLGCSTDGLVQCACHGQRLLEIKCPYTLRSLPVKCAARQRGCQQDLISDKWFLREDHPHYYQIQTQLYVYGLLQCDLCIYTLKGILIIPVMYNEEFTQTMINKAEHFYKSCVLKALLYGETDEENRARTLPASTT